MTESSLLSEDEDLMPNIGKDMVIDILSMNKELVGLLFDNLFTKFDLLNLVS